MKNRKSVAIFGTYPPPIGGTSIHVKRLLELLETKSSAKVYNTFFGAKNESEKVVNLENKIWFYLKFIFTIKEDVVSCHTHNWLERFILVVISLVRNKKVIITYHSLRKELDKEKFMIRMMANFVLRFSDVHVAINSEIEDKLISWGASKKNTVILPTFLLPRDSDEEIGNEFIESIIENTDFTICSNASNNNHFNGTDVYGIDFCIDVFKRIVDVKPNTKFIFLITRITNKEYFDLLREKINSLDLENSFYLLNESVNYSALLSKCNLSIRATCTDTYGLSVGESIHQKNTLYR